MRVSFLWRRSAAEAMELRRDSITMNRLMEQVFADMEDRIRDSKLEFVVRLTRDDTAMVTDNSYLYRICQNLMENALKYSAAGTRVFVNLVDEQNQIGLEITNTAGYRMDFDKEDIVGALLRGDKARTTEGNGLGLAIVSTYAKALGAPSTSLSTAISSRRGCCLDGARL